jgi:3-dehydroquinate synthase
MSMKIHSKIKDYELNFSDDMSFVGEMAKLSPRIVIVDENVYKYYKDVLNQHFSLDEIVTFTAVETNKNIQSVLDLCDKVMGFAAKKNMNIISFGGGITQDVTGFLASILYRGVNWIFVPTTLLAQSDSCMGSKTSLNHKHYKNLLGDFYPPTSVYINTQFTRTLSEMDFYSGIGEIVKLHLMGGANLIKSIEVDLRNIECGRNDSNFLNRLVKESLEVKYSYIKDDEFDTGKRNLLNFGHCFGHALETSSNYAIPHGIAVVIGMIFANIIAVKRGFLSEAKEKTLLSNVLINSIKFPLEQAFFDKEKILAAMKMDKKRVGNGLPLIILRDDLELEKLTDMTPDELFWGMDALNVILFNKK